MGSSKQQQQQQHHHKKRVIAIRHGESEWNVRRRIYTEEKDRYCNEMYLPDCSLTFKGIEQCHDAAMSLLKLLQEDTAAEEETIGQAPDCLIVVSPLRRALQTTLGVLKALPNNKPSQQQSHSLLLQNMPKPLVHPDCSEIMMDSCDIGSPIEQLQMEFVNSKDDNHNKLEFDFDFSLLLKNRPNYWWPYHHSPQETWERMRHRKEDGIETESMVHQRIDQFKQYINAAAQDYDIIVIVCHSETIWWLTSQLIISEDGGLTQEGKGTAAKRKGFWTKNCEVVDITNAVLTDGNGLDPTLLSDYMY